MITVNFDSEKDTYKTAAGLWQWDYGQVLQFVGLSLPAAVEIHFSLQQSGGDAITRIGVTEDNSTTVGIPDEMLENNGKTTDYTIYAFVYTADEESGETVYRISMPVKSRPRPKRVSETTMEALMAAINKIADGKADSLEYKNNVLRLLAGEKELDRVTITGGSGSGEDAREIELQKGKTAIQWRYVGDPEWKDLISLEEITGADGKDGRDGEDGITPHIGDNGNWYLGETDTGKPIRGENGPAGEPGRDGVNGADGKSAYQFAQEGGYTGTEEEFAVLVGKQIQQNKEDISKLSEEIADKATLENGVIKFWKTSTEESGTDVLLYSVDISSIGGTGGLDLENLTLSVSQVGNYQRLSMSDGTTTKTVDIPITVISDEQVQTAVESWLDEHPEATTTVGDKSINPDKTTWLRQIFHNIFDASTITDGYYFFSNANANVTGGGTANYFVSDYIPVEAGESYLFSHHNMQLRWFDSNKAFIAGTASNVPDNKAVVVAPDTAYYVRFSANKDSITADVAQIYEYLGEIWDYDTYMNLYDIRISNDSYTKALVELVKQEIEKGNVDIGELIALENIPFEKIKGIEEWHWNIVNPKIVTHSWSGTYWRYTTDYIPVQEGDIYYVLYAIVTGYDADYVSQGRINNTSGVIAIPSGVSFIKIDSGYTSDENYVFRVYKRGYGKNDLTYSSDLDYDVCFPMFRNEIAKDGFKSYLGVYPWADKKFGFIGDSFSAPNKWQSIICVNLKAINEANGSISGGAFADYDGVPKTAYEQAQNFVTNGKKLDVIFITLGTNDSANKITLGEIVYSTSIDDFDLTTYTGGMQACLNYLKNNYPDAIIFIGWTPMGGLNLNENDKYISRMKEVAVKYGIEYIETRTCGVTTLCEVYADCYENGVNGGHPTDNGQNKIGEYMTRVISGKK